MNYVYICSPYRDDVDYNVGKAQYYCQFAVSQGVLPIAPHIYFTQFLDDNESEERQLGLKMGLDLMQQCSELWVFGSKISEEMSEEINAAERMEISVVYYTDKCENRSLKGGEQTMILRKEKIMDLTQQRGISQNELARLMNVAHGSLSNALSGRRQAGRKILAGLLTIFPKESVASLTVKNRY